MFKGFGENSLHVLIGVILVISSAPTSSEAQVKIGQACEKAGQSKSVKGIKLTCKRESGKKVWRRAKPIPNPPSPSITPSPTPIPTPTASPTPKVNPSAIPTPTPIISPTPSPTFVESPITDFQSVQSCRLQSTVPNRERTGFPRVDSLRSSGQLRGVLVLVQFADQPNTSDVITEWKGRQIPALKKFIYASSFQKLAVDIDIHPSAVILGNSSEYRLNSDGNPDLFGLTDQALSRVDSTLDFSPYDFITIAYGSTPNKVAGVIGFGRTLDGRSFSGGLIVGSIREYYGEESKKNWLVHEFGHLLGLTHPYAFDNEMPIWDLMGNTTTDVPDFSAWHKFYLGWIEDSQVRCLSTKQASRVFVTLSPISSRENGSKIVVIRKSETQAYFIEYRGSEEIDDLRGEYSVNVYLVDTSISDGKGSIKLLKETVKDFALENWSLKVTSKSNLEIEVRG